MALLVVAAGLSFTPTATANPYCADVEGIEGTGREPVCTVRCLLTADPEARPIMPPCMWHD